MRGRGHVLDVKDGDKLLASKEVTLDKDGVGQDETMFFNAGDAGVKSIGFALEPLPGEENTANNAVTRLVDVSGEQKRILYVEGEPRWEFKFIRRAEAEDKGVRDRLHAADDGEQDLPAGNCGPDRTGGWVSDQGGGPVQVPGDHYR